MKRILIPTASALLFTLNLSAAPVAPENLQGRCLFDFAGDFAASSSVFNPVYSGSYVYVNQINSRGFGRYDSGWGTPLLLVTPDTEHRMVKPFPGTLGSAYIVASSSGYSGATTTTFTRYNLDGTGAVTAPTPSARIAEGFDFVDDFTIIHTAYDSGFRKNLYLVKVTAEPFALEADTRWNPDGYVTTLVTTRIRNVRVGDVYKDYAYYGDNGQLTNPKFYALNLATGASTELGNAGILSGTGSFGLWTVIERGGYLYVHTTDNGVQIYNMNSATSLGSLVTTYTKTDLDTVAGSAQYWGFDVTSDGSKFILGGVGKCWEFGAPELKISMDSSYVTLAYPSNLTAVAVQSATAINGGFNDVNPQPSVYQDGKTNLAPLLRGTGTEFFRLRRNP